MDKSLPIDQYEELQSSLRRRSSSNRSSGDFDELILSRQDREELLLEWGVSFTEMIDAIRTNVKIKNQRRRTVNAIGTYDRIEEIMERTAKQIKNKLKLTKSNTHKQRHSNNNNYQRQNDPTNGSHNMIHSVRSSDSSLTGDHPISSTTSSVEIISEVNDYSTTICTPASSRTNITAASNDNESKNRQVKNGTENYSAIDEEIVAMVAEKTSRSNLKHVDGDQNVPVGMDIPMVVPKRSPSVESALTDQNTVPDGDYSVQPDNEYTENQSITSENSNDSDDSVQNVAVDLRDMTITEQSEDADGTIPSKFLHEFGEFVSSDYHPNQLKFNHATAVYNHSEYNTKPQPEILTQQSHHHMNQHPPVITVTQTPPENISSFGFTPVKHVIVAETVKNQMGDVQAKNYNNCDYSVAESMTEHEYREIHLPSYDFQPLSPISEFTGGGFHSSTSSSSMMQYNLDDGDFDALVRDSSFWELCPGQHDSPKIRRKIIPVIITEDTSLGESNRSHMGNQVHHPLVVLPGTDPYTMNGPTNFYPIDNNNYYPHLKYPMANPYPTRQLPPHTTSIGEVVPAKYPLPVAPRIVTISTSASDARLPDVQNYNVKHNIGSPLMTSSNLPHHVGFIHESQEPYGGNMNRPHQYQPSPSHYSIHNHYNNDSSPTEVYTPTFEAPTERLYDNNIAGHEQQQHYYPHYNMDDLSYDYNTVCEEPSQQRWEQSGFRMEPPPNSTTLLHKMMM
jgi:hypothetical protein